jgi:hypothetical protein
MHRPIGLKTHSHLPAHRADEHVHPTMTARRASTVAVLEVALDDIDTDGLELIEEVPDAHGFDPYGHVVRHPAKKPSLPRTDLRALSAQILAERARRTGS